MSGTLLEILTYLCTTGLGGFFGWLFSRRRYNAEVKNAEVNNFDAALDAYKKMYDNMISEYKQKNEDLYEEVASLKRKLAATEKQVLTLTNYILAQAVNGHNNVNDLQDILNSEANKD